MKRIYRIFTPFCLFTSAATAATFPSAYELRRITAEEGVQISGPLNDHSFDFGRDVSPLGDINGDSLMDFAIGYAEGSFGLLLIYGSPSLVSTQIDMQSVVSMGMVVSGRTRVAAVGDFNGDGYDDWITRKYIAALAVILNRSSQQTAS